MSEPNNALAGQKATVPEAIDLRALSLIGIMDAHDGKAALLRSSRGQIERVSIGEEAFGVRITAIGDDQVLMTDRWGRSQSLALPQG